MGRTCGSLALHSAIAVAANVVIIPEIQPDIKKLLAGIEHNRHSGNRSMIIIITENTLPGGGNGLKKKIDSKYPELDSRVTILGHLQRGGSPSAYDRNLASLLGYHATTALLNGRKNLMAGSINGKIKFTALSDVAGKTHAINPLMMDIANQFSLLI